MEEQAEDYITKGVDRFRHGRYSEALALFDRAVSLDPGCTRAWNGRAAALGNLGLFDAALDSCDTAIATDPGYFRAWSNRGWVLGHLGRNAEALDSCDRAIALQPDFAEAWHTRGWVLTNLAGTWKPWIPATGQQLQPG